MAGDLWLAIGGLLHSTDGGATWTTTRNMTTNILTVGFGVSASGSGYPAVYTVGWLNRKTFGVWRSDNAETGGGAPVWRQLGPWPLNSLDSIVDISGDPNIYGQIYVGFSGSGFAFLHPSHRTEP
jgi:hypothetical protein